MSKKDVKDIAIGCIAWAAVIALSILTGLGILDFETVFNYLCYVLCGLAIILVLLVSLLFFLRS